MDNYENKINYSLLSDWHLFWLLDQSEKVAIEYLRRCKERESELLKAYKEYKEMRKMNDNK